MLGIAFRHQGQGLDQRAQMLFHALRGQIAVASLDGIDDSGVLVGQLRHGGRRIEGEKAHVFALKQRIFADKRHKNTEILLLQRIEHRRFADWRMRLLFLERWLWSPASKKQAAQLSPYLPFAPHNWSPDRTENFLQIIKTFDTGAGCSFSW